MPRTNSSAFSGAEPGSGRARPGGGEAPRGVAQLAGASFEPRVACRALGQPPAATWGYPRYFDAAKGIGGGGGGSHGLSPVDSFGFDIRCLTHSHSASAAKEIGSSRPRVHFTRAAVYLDGLVFTLWSQGALDFLANVLTLF